MTVIDRTALEDSPLADLHAIASELSIDGYRRLRKEQLIDAILERQEGGADETQAELFERSIGVLRQPTELAKAAAGLERREQVSAQQVARGLAGHHADAQCAAVHYLRRPRELLARKSMSGRTARVSTPSCRAISSSDRPVATNRRARW